MRHVFIDSDVILDFFLDRKPHSSYAALLFAQVEREEIRGFITAVIISNVYYILRQLSSHDRIINKLNQFMQVVDVLPVYKNSIVKAMHSDFKDFEDAIQN